jgi:hypothetical protein
MIDFSRLEAVPQFDDKYVAFDSGTTKLKLEEKKKNTKIFFSSSFINSVSQRPLSQVCRAMMNMQ